MEHRKDEALEKEQQALASKPKGKTEQEARLENGLTLIKSRSVAELMTVKPTNEVTGIDNAAFESEKL
jgi:hypothetical protein